MLNDILQHRGVGHDDNPPGRGSGRFGWGTGENPGQHQFNFISEVNSMRKSGLSDLEIAKALLGERARAVDLKAEMTIAKNELKQIHRAQAWEMVEKCNGNISEAARRLGMKNESSLRSLIDPIRKQNQDRYQNVADTLKKVVDEKKLIDISSDSNIHLGINKNTMDIAVKMLEHEGYVKSYVNIPQMGTGKETSVRVLAPPGTTYGEIQKMKFDLKPVVEFTPDNGAHFFTPEFPTSLDSKRIYVRYKDEGGDKKDGVIELRPGVEDISLGDTTYSQVRIAVDGTHYIKGMAMYSNDIPKGYDVVVNTPKSRETPLIGPSKDNEVLKRLKIDKATGEVDRDNPFGALIKGPKEIDGVVQAGGQRHYLDKDGNKQLSPINKVNDEGDWNNWSKNISSQFLAKQPLKIINQQLDLTIKDKKLQLDEINNLTNPVVKKRLLNDFAEGCDSLATKLKANGFKNQAFQVILPVPSLKDTEVYAPNYNNGDTVALVRYPHAGLFEIPILKVNNKNKDAKIAIGNSKDAIGINARNAEILSGADFDGDSVTVIPMTSNRLSIKNTKPLKDLEGFDPKTLWKLPDDAPRMKSQTKQTEMGKVTNLITDMTIGGDKGASLGEIARAVKHSMVVIDAEKHHLDYKGSAKEYDIESLKKKYQGINKQGNGAGASTILSKASSEIYVPKRKEVTRTSEMTPAELKRWNAGMKVYRETGETIKKQIKDPSKMTADELKLHQAGKKVYRETSELRTEKVTRMSNTDDAFTLVRDKNNAKEVAYANYANNLKALANSARQTARSIKPVKVDKSAQKMYASEVKSLEEKLIKAKSNSPKERIAQALANKKVAQKKADNPGMDYESIKKAKGLAIQEARAIVGAKKEKVKITDREWEAIQSNAISTNKLTGIISNADPDRVKQLATPKNSKQTLSSSKIAMMKAMFASGMYTQKEIAERFGVSPSTVSNAIR